MKMAFIINKNAINSICSMCFIFLMNAYLFKCQTNTFLMETNLGKFLQNITSKKYESKSTHSEYRKLDKNAVIAAFEGFRQIIDDPMVVSEQPMSHNIADIIRTEGYIKNISVFHLRNATLNRVFIADDDSYGEVEITFPVLRVAGSYNMTFWLDRHNISMYGNGSFAFELENLKVALNMTFEKTSQGYGELNKIGWNQTLEGVKIDITNLLDDAEVSSMFSENLSVIIPSLHRTYKPAIDEFMSHAVTVYWKVLFLKNNLSNLNNAVASNGISSLQTLVRALANEAENIRKDYSLAP